MSTCCIINSLVFLQLLSVICPSCHFLPSLSPLPSVLFEAALPLVLCSNFLNISRKSAASASFYRDTNVGSNNAEAGFYTADNWVLIQMSTSNIVETPQLKSYIIIGSKGFQVLNYTSLMSESPQRNFIISFTALRVWADLTSAKIHSNSPKLV